MVRLQTSASVLTGVALLLSTACASTPTAQTQSPTSLTQAAAVPTAFPSPTPLPQKDAMQVRCDALADSPYDPQRTGAGVLDAAKRYSEAAQWYQQAGARGFADGFTNVGRIYLLGDAAYGGQTDAMSQLGQLYLSGTGVQKNPTTGVQWFRTAADLGNAQAESWLGYAYMNGVGERTGLRTGCQGASLA